MFASSFVAGPTDALARLQDAVRELLGLQLGSCAGLELVELLRGLETVRRQLAVVDQNIIAELEAQGVPGELAAASTADLLRQLLRVSPREASARVHAARSFGPRRGVSGEPLSPLFPAVADAQAEGALSPAHGRVITDAIESLPAQVEAEHGREAQAVLVEHARHLDPSQLAKAAHRLCAILNPDGAEPADEKHRLRREFRLIGNVDGSGRVSGHLTPTAMAVWQTVLDSLSAPAPAEDGVRDERSVGQRQHDGFLDAGMRLLRSGELPDAGGVPVTVSVTITVDQLESRVGMASVAHGGLLSVADLLQLADEADVLPIVLNDAGGVVAYGRTKRLASPGQRQALAARDGGCSFPGCDRPPSWCQAHHVVAWIDGGSTDLGNLTLVCGHHHREFARRGWECQMIDGVPHWLPPGWLDPDRTPRRNRTRDNPLVPV